MTVLHPCYHCNARGHCELHAAKLEAIRAAKLSLATFRCNIIRNNYKPGQRVMVTVKTFEDFGEGEYAESKDEFRATVMRWDGRKIMVFLDDREHCESGEGGSANSQWMRVWPNKVEPIDGTTTLCRSCDKPLGVKPQLSARGSEWSCIDCCPSPEIQAAKAAVVNDVAADWMF